MPFSMSTSFPTDAIIAFGVGNPSASNAVSTSLSAAMAITRDARCSEHS